MGITRLCSLQVEDMLGKLENSERQTYARPAVDIECAVLVREESQGDQQWLSLLAFAGRLRDVLPEPGSLSCMNGSCTPFTHTVHDFSGPHQRDQQCTATRPGLDAAWDSLLWDHLLWDNILWDNLLCGNLWCYVPGYVERQHVKRGTGSPRTATNKQANRQAWLTRVSGGVSMPLLKARLHTSLYLYCSIAEFHGVTNAMLANSRKLMGLRRSQ